MSRFQRVRGPLLLAALVLFVLVVWRALSATPGSGPGGTSLGSRDRQAAVIGVSVNGQSRAYPLRLLSAEVVDDELGGQPIVVTF